MVDGYHDQAFPDDVWVTGRFEGAYVGTLAGALVSANKEDERHYRIDRFENARLSDVTVLEGAPSGKGEDHRPPIRLPFARPVVVNLDTGAGSEPRQFIAELEDFRLYDWRELNAGEIPSFFGKRSAGWLTGRAYGILRHYEVPAATDKHQQPTERNDQPHDLAAGGTAAQEDAGTVAARPGNADGAAQGTPVAEEVAAGSCLACWLWLRLVLAALVWYFCSWKHALVFFGVTQLACWLSDTLIAPRGWKRNLLIAIIALLALAGCLLEAYALAFSDDCSLITDWPIYLIGTALVLTAFLPFCWLRLMMLAVWFLTTAVWCGANSMVCDAGKDETRIDVLVHEVDVKVDYVVNPDVDVDVVNENTNDPTNPDNNRKISIDEVTKDPELLDKCGNSIYFSEVALFQVREYSIEPRAEVQLRKLASVLSKKKDRKVIITGHADKSGDDSDEGYLKNIDLSNARAKAVADWLVNNAGVDPARLEIRGAGTGMPITQDPQSSHLNRRVEVELECPSDKKARK